MGIVFGFVLTFTCFALASRTIVAALHVSTDLIREGSLILLLLFGIVLISDWMSEKFSQSTQRLATLGGSFSPCGKDGLLSGFAVGGLIGLIWTPVPGR